MLKILILFLPYMLFSQSFDFVSLLGKDVSVISFDGINPEFSSLKNKYFISFQKEKSFFNMGCNHIIFNTNDDQLVNSIKLSFSKIVDRDSFNSLVKNYGDPDSIEVIKNRETINASIRKKDSTIQSLNKNFISTEQGSFEENPLYIMWNSKEFQIELLMKYGEGESRIIFKAPESKL